MRAAALALILTLTALHGAALAESYLNPRFGTSVTFPETVFTQPQPAPENGDGQRWRSADGAELTVFGSYNVLDQKPAAFHAELVAARKASTDLTYSRAGDNWAVVSGFDGSQVYYEKYLFGQGKEIIHAVILRYPKSLKAEYDPLVGPIANSLAGP
jgi:hypothetical protein